MSNYPPFKKVGDELQGNSTATDNTTPILTPKPESVPSCGDGWISIKDRLPDEDVNVLFYVHSDHIEGYYCSVDKVFKPELDGAGYMENDIIIIDPTHWMPLPKAPTKH